jgi:hypothetical protein
VPNCEILSKTIGKSFPKSQILERKENELILVFYIEETLFTPGLQNLRWNPKKREFA